MLVWEHVVLSAGYAEPDRHERSTGEGPKGKFGKLRTGTLRIRCFCADQSVPKGISSGS